MARHGKRNFEAKIAPKSWGEKLTFQSIGGLILTLITLNSMFFDEFERSKFNLIFLTNMTNPNVVDNHSSEAFSRVQKAKRGKRKEGERKRRRREGRRKEKRERRGENTCVPVILVIFSTSELQKGHMLRTYRMRAVPHGQDKGPTSLRVPGGPPESTEKALKTPKPLYLEIVPRFWFSNRKKWVLWGPRNPNLPSGHSGQARNWTFPFYHTCGQF